MLKGKKIVIGITGSIAAYKIPFLVRLLVREGADVKVIMTPTAREFVTPLTLSTLSQKPVIIEPFEQDSGNWNNHVELGRWADVVVFAPVSANTLGKMANGVADNFLVTAYLSAKCPVFIAPAMDLDMYLHPSTQANIATLKSYGNTIIEPRTGELASGLSGPGRMEEPEEILKVLEDHFRHCQDLVNKKVLVTAGPTYENIDPVRFLGNYSTGKMGFCLAEEAARRGAEVALVTGPACLEINHPAIRVTRVRSAAEMYAQCMDLAPWADVVLMAAAVADYTVSMPAERKMKKETDTFTLQLEPTKDILSEIGRNRREEQVIVGFALETDDEVRHAEQKLKAKNLDMIVLNSLNEAGAGFGLDTNKITVITPDGIVYSGGVMPKPAVASAIVDLIVKFRTRPS